MGNITDRLDIAGRFKRGRWIRTGKLIDGLIVSPVRMYTGWILWFSHRYTASASADTSSFSQ